MGVLQASEASRLLHRKTPSRKAPQSRLSNGAVPSVYAVSERRPRVAQLFPAGSKVGLGYQERMLHRGRGGANAVEADTEDQEGLNRGANKVLLSQGVEERNDCRRTSKPLLRQELYLARLEHAFEPSKSEHRILEHLEHLAELRRGGRQGVQAVRPNNMGNPAIPNLNAPYLSL